MRWILFSFSIFLSFIWFFSFSRSQKIYVINLEHRTDRLKFMQKQLDYFKKSFYALKAVNGRLVQEDFFRSRVNRSALLPFESKADLNIIFKDNLTYEQLGHFGAWQSHVKAYLSILQSKHNETILILEDDAGLDGNFFAKLDNEIAALPENWDVFHIGHALKKNMIGPQCSNAKICKSDKDHPLFGAQAYVLRNYTVAENLLKYSNLPQMVIADQFMHKTNLSIFVRFPPLAVQKRDIYKSDIERKYCPLFNDALEAEIKL